MNVKDSYGLKPFDIANQSKNKEIINLMNPFWPIDYQKQYSPAAPKIQSLSVDNFDINKRKKSPFQKYMVSNNVGSKSKWEVSKEKQSNIKS